MYGPRCLKINTITYKIYLLNLLVHDSFLILFAAVYTLGKQKCMPHLKLSNFSCKILHVPQLVQYCTICMSLFNHISNQFRQYFLQMTTCLMKMLPRKGTYGQMVRYKFVSYNTTYVYVSYNIHSFNINLHNALKTNECLMIILSKFAF